PNRSISVDLVRNLYGVVEAERATSGLLVATCDFTRDAQRFRATVKHRLTLRGKETLKEWLRGCNPSQPSRN
ncbi:MAG: restriction endonuclease, partial [Chromatiales bacterium]|nr:restriction endonuclease [Chromatiales bacterium]